MLNQQQMGRFRFSKTFVRTCPETALRIFSRVVILEAQCIGDVIEYIGYSEYFEQLEGFDYYNQKQTIPLYKFEFDRGMIKCEGVKLIEPSKSLKMLPCPFCGSENIEEYPNNHYQATAVYCKDCPAGLEDNKKTVDELKILWNERT